MIRRNITPFDILIQNQRDIINETKLNSSLINDQNKLLQTKLQIQEHINSARKVKKNVGAKSSPKRKGGQIK
jgi:hypothetical protein